MALIAPEIHPLLFGCSGNWKREVPPRPGPGRFTSTSESTLRETEVTYTTREERDVGKDTYLRMEAKSQNESHGEAIPHKICKNP